MKYYLIILIEVQMYKSMKACFYANKHLVIVLIQHEFLTNTETRFINVYLIITLLVFHQTNCSNIAVQRKKKNL